MAAVLTLDSVPLYERSKSVRVHWFSPLQACGWEGDQTQECSTDDFIREYFDVNGDFRAGVAQLVEHLICNQRVGGSNPFASSTDRPRRVKFRRASFYRGSVEGLRACPLR